MPVIWEKRAMAQLPPFYWNYNAGPGYNAQNDPAFWAAQTKYQEDQRNSDLQDSEQAAEDLLTKKQANLTATGNAQAQANQLKTNVEGQRSALLAGVSGDTDPGAAVNQTTNTINSIPLTPTHSPIGDIFSNLTGQYAVAALAARNGQPGFGVLTPFKSKSNLTGF
jgi:hypothetical protein